MGATGGWPTAIGYALELAQRAYHSLGQVDAAPFWKLTPYDLSLAIDGHDDAVRERFEIDTTIWSWAIAHLLSPHAKKGKKIDPKEIKRGIKLEPKQAESTDTGARGRDNEALDFLQLRKELERSSLPTTTPATPDVILGDAD